MLIALVPAHNEARNITNAISGLETQSVAPDKIVVVTDNCTDDTAAVAQALGAEVFETVDNGHKKAGALNQALAWLLPQLSPDDVILVQDADSVLDAPFIATGLDYLAKGFDAVGGVFRGEAGHGLLGMLQRNEYMRYARELSRKPRVMVLSGTASMFAVATLQAVSQARHSGEVPEGDGVYDTTALTEDNELTLALKTLGRRLASPAECGVSTELMPTWRALWKQRLRWQRGALENIRRYGLSRVTLPYFAQQVGMAIGVLAMTLYLGMSLTAFVLLDAPFTLSPFWTAVGLVFVAERVATVKGRAAKALAFPLLIEMAYDLFQMGVFLASVTQIVFRREAKWSHFVQ
jgi:cellulose synthase/poly-beta-1,6-N-acetylglucosamine synthase-like glycosyltransferase